MKPSLYEDGIVVVCQSVCFSSNYQLPFAVVLFHYCFEKSVTLESSESEEKGGNGFWK